MTDKQPWYKRWKFIGYMVIIGAVIFGILESLLNSKKRRNAIDGVINKEPKAPNELYVKQDELQEKANDQVGELNQLVDERPDPIGVEGDFSDMIAKHNQDR